MEPRALITEYVSIPLQERNQEDFRELQVLLEASDEQQNHDQDSKGHSAFFRAVVNTPCILLGPRPPNTVTV